MISDFTVNVITKAINKIPNQWGLIQEMRIFPDEPITTTRVTIEQHNGVLNLIESKDRRSDERGKNLRGKRALYTFDVPHLPLDDTLLATDIQDVRAFGDAVAGTTETVELQKILRGLRMKHAITWEYFKSQALMKGQVIDADGSVLADMFDIFDITQEVKTFDFSTADFNVQGEILDAKGYIQDNIMGDTITGYIALCSPEWFKELISHPLVREDHKFFVSQNGAKLGQTDVREMFVYNNVTFIEYRGKASWIDPDGVSVIRDFITPDEAIMFPVGTISTYANYLAPGNLIAAANTRGIELYAFQKKREDESGWNIFSESNHLPLCKRPQVLVRLIKT